MSVQGSESKVQGSGVRAAGLGFCPPSSPSFSVQGLESRVQGLGFKIEGLGLGLRVWGLGCQV